MLGVAALAVAADLGEVFGLRSWTVWSVVVQGAVRAVGGLACRSGSAEAREEGEMASAEGAEGQDGAADDGEVEFADGEGVAVGGVPGEVLVAEDGGRGPDVHGADQDGDAAEGEEAAEDDGYILPAKRFYDSSLCVDSKTQEDGGKRDKNTNQWNQTSKILLWIDQVGLHARRRWKEAWRPDWRLGHIAHWTPLKRSRFKAQLHTSVQSTKYRSYRLHGHDGRRQGPYERFPHRLTTAPSNP